MAYGFEGFVRIGSHCSADMLYSPFPEMLSGKTAFEVLLILVCTACWFRIMQYVSPFRCPRSRI